MYVVVKLPGEGETLQRSIQMAIMVQAEAWAQVVKRKPIPLIYSLPLRFIPEPADSIAEEWCDPYTVLERGFGDCDDLVIYRLSQIYAEMGFNFDPDQCDKMPAWPCVEWLKGTGRYHVSIRCAAPTPFTDEFRVEDPAKFFLQKYGAQ